MPHIHYTTPNMELAIDCEKREVEDKLSALVEILKEDDEDTGRIVITFEDGDIQIYDINKELP